MQVKCYRNAFSRRNDTHCNRERTRAPVRRIIIVNIIRKMNIENRANISEKDFAELENELVNHKTLGRVLSWAGSKSQSEVLPQIVAEVVTQDEFTHDVIIPYKHLFLVCDTT